MTPSKRLLIKKLVISPNDAGKQRETLQGEGIEGMRRREFAPAFIVFMQ